MPVGDRRINATALVRLLGPQPPGAPAYRSIADSIQRLVIDGALPLGTRVPSERELAAAFGISRTTTSAAYDRLRETGVLHTKRGSGSVTTLPAGSPRGGGLLVPDTTRGGPIDLTIATPPAPSALPEALQRASERLPEYGASGGEVYLGLPALRAAVAEHYTRRGVPTRPDQILITTGAQQATHLLVEFAAGPGDRVAIEHPAYPHAVAAIRARGARPVPVPVTDQGLDLDMLEATIRQASPRLIHFQPDNQNPTGTSLDEAARARLRDLAARYRTIAVGDETLSSLTLEGEQPPPFLGPRPNEHLVAIGSASKVFWGGLRIGWIRAHQDLILKLGLARVHHDLSSSVLDQLIVVELLAMHDAVLAERSAGLRVRRDTLLEALDPALPWSIDIPSGGMSLWADLGSPVSSRLAAVAPRYGVRVAPGTTFGIDGAFKHRMRLPFTTSPDDIRIGVSALMRAWADTGADPSQDTFDTPPI